MVKKKSILSSAELIAEILSDDEGVKSLVKMFYPIMPPDQASTPYVVYRIAKVYTNPNSQGSADTADIEVMCCGTTVAQMIETSEVVRCALDGVQSVSGDGLLKMRSCQLTGCTEGWEAQTYYRTLTFRVRIN